MSILEPKLIPLYVLVSQALAFMVALW